MKVGIQVFAALVVIVLLSACDQDKFTLNIFGNEDAVGAKVFVDGKHVGQMDKFSDKGSRFAKLFPHGRHLVEVKKEGYLAYEQTIRVSEDASEHYLNVELKPEHGVKSENRMQNDRSR